RHRLNVRLKLFQSNCKLRICSTNVDFYFSGHRPMDSSFKACVYLLPGETVKHDEPIVDGRLIFTDYRLVIVATPPGNIWSVPIALLWKAETVNLTFLKLTTKLALSVIICPTYPEYHIVPFGIQDSAVVNMAEFRTHRRFPSVVWRSQVTGAVLLRCAQPCVGLMFYRNQCDEQFMASVSKSCRENPGSKQIPGPTRLLIVDARTYRVAQLKRLLGGGSEHPDYYDQAQVCFMNMPNVHAVRLSFERLTQLYTLDTDVSWYSMLEKTCWLNYIAQLIKSALDIAFALEVDGRPVMVHCTDGWDRTAQLSSLAQLLADPYYRTVEGFVVLVEREWLYFGHKFADRCGQGGCNAYPDERSPIFLQWLDCVHQVRRQFPNYFEFSETFLVKLGLHIYSGLFGTFLGNSEENRQTVKLNARTCSVWALLSPRLNRRVINPFYKPGNQRLIVPSCSLPNLCLWDNLYRHALFPASKNVMGIVCLNEPRSAVVVNGPSEPSDFNTADQSTVTDSDNSSGLIPVESDEIREIAAHDEASEMLPPATAHIDESLFNNLCTNPELDTQVHRNFLGDLTNTATHTGCCLSPFSMDGNLDTEPKQFVFPVTDPSSSITAKKKLDSAPLDNTVAILPLSSVTKSPSDWYFSSSLRKSYCSHSSLNGVNEAIPHLNGVHLCDVSDLSKQCAVCVSVTSKRLSFSEDCNDVFVADEETPSTTDRHMKSVKECCPHSGLAPEKSLESDDQDVDEHDTSICCLHSGIVAQTQSTSTPPVNIGSNSCLSIRTHGEVRSTKRLSRCRTPSDNHSFVSFGSIESQRTPVSTVRRKSLESLGRVVCTPDTEDPSDNSDFTVHVSFRMLTWGRFLKIHPRLFHFIWKRSFLSVISSVIKFLSYHLVKFPNNSPYQNLIITKLRTCRRVGTSIDVRYRS
ncbi:Myotubularin protein 3, partial [Fasciola gigantica]